MLGIFNKAIDYFIPEEVRQETSNLMKVRTFVFLHLLGPAMGHSVILFLWQASKHLNWQFWTIEASVLTFWAVPLLVKYTKTLVVPATVSVLVLVFLSLFGSFFYGGISSPFLPWLLISLLIGFFYLSEHVMAVLIGVVAELVVFVAARLIVGNFPMLLPLSSLTYVNLLSILSALVYITMLSMYYETVMRSSAELEQATREQRAQAIALREAMKRAEQASQQKSIFLAKMSHELRTPLNAVIGYSEMLRDDLEDDPSASQRAGDLERINAAGRHLLALVTNVLDLSSIESNRLEVAYETVQVSQLIRDVMATAAPLVAKKDNQLVLQMPADPGPIETDPLKLRQCILNLLSNAAKFTTRGKITLTVMKRQMENNERLIVEVRDTGIGMSEEGLKNIFTDFGQAEKDTAQKFGGTGLGLALTRRFCAMMGGQVTVESRLGEGSSFVIDIPCHSRPDTAGLPLAGADDASARSAA